MASDNEERIDVRGDGRIILYRREGLKNPRWQTRTKVPNASGCKVVTTNRTVVGPCVVPKSSQAGGLSGRSGW